MIGKLKKFLRGNRILLLLTALGAVLVFGSFIISNKPYSLMIDKSTQYDIFYSEWIRLLKEFFFSRQFPYYSWNTFLGSDYLINKVYYLSGDPFILILMWLPLPVWVILILEDVIVLFIAALGMSVFLKQFGIQDQRIRTAVALLYAFSSVSCLYSANPMFFRFFGILPWLFYGVERYFTKGKAGLFALLVTVELWQSYYFMVPTTWFLVLYCLFSYFFKGLSKNLKAILSKALPLMGAYLIGVLMSGILILPALLELLAHPRFGAVESTGFFWSLITNIGVLFSLITPAFNIGTTVPFIFAVGTNGHAWFYSLFSSALCVIALSWQIAYGKKRKLVIGSLVVFLAFLLILPLNSIIHGFSEPSLRWSFLLLFFILLVVAITLEEWQKQKPPSLKKGYLIFTALIFVCTILGLILGFISWPAHQFHLAVTYGFLLTGWGYVFLLEKGRTALVLLLTTVEALFAFVLTTQVMTRSVKNMPDVISANYLQLLQNSDEDRMFRIFIDHIYFYPSVDTNLNQPMKLGYLGTSTYDSLYETGLLDFLALAKQTPHIMEINDSEILRMLGVKYWMVLAETDLPENYEFDFIETYGQFSLYQLRDYQKIGFTYSSFQQSSQTSTFQNWNQVLLVQDDLYQIVSGFSKSDKQALTIIQRGVNQLIGTITVDSDTVLFLSIPYNQGWRILDNGEPVVYHKVQGGFIGIVLAPGNHTIEMNYVPQYLKAGALLSALGGLLFLAFFVIIPSVTAKMKHGKLKQGS
ncbi:MAG: YfhO family protein [Erysipelotrichaceae bacterium]|jgi:uncharacterized membrane protein YfhO|nr:YfhO family protein [Erysipelotrichaceae bacterium]